eukprot:GEMP01108611.1.p1 GENE.GEMP01108611.1~~GEMP01108611.1.p1  ORF type:complete len:172 (+),score=33.40 GEMP01108611.1:128-643(+)
MQPWERFGAICATLDSSMAPEKWAEWPLFNEALQAKDYDTCGKLLHRQRRRQPLLRVPVVMNDHSVSCIVDSGAETSHLSMHLCHALSISIFPCPCGTAHGVGASIPIIGFAEVHLRFETDGEAITITALVDVMDFDCNDFVLGLDLLHRERGEINCATRSLKLRDKNVVS